MQFFLIAQGMPRRDERQKGRRKNYRLRTNIVETLCMNEIFLGKKQVSQN